MRGPREVSGSASRPQGAYRVERCLFLGLNIQKDELILGKREEFKMGSFQIHRMLIVNWYRTLFTTEGTETSLSQRRVIEHLLGQTLGLQR